MKRRVTVSLAEDLLEALDRAPGKGRSEKIERLLKQALTAGAQRRWVSELEAFYDIGGGGADRAEDTDWQALAAQAFERDD
jgi:hypothetical protein